MKNKFIISLGAICLALLSIKAHSQSIVIDTCKMHSEILNMDRNYSVYLPDGYFTSYRTYPVLYLLHGGGDDHTKWIQNGRVQHVADAAIKSGKAAEMIIIMPDAQTKIRGYANVIGGEFNYEDFFVEEFIPYIESTYRIKGTKEYRAISGLSLGGGGSFYYALHQPELFSSCCPMSANIRPDREEVLNRIYGDIAKDKSKKERDEWIDRYDILKMFEEMPLEHLKATRWYIAIGDDDFLYDGSSMLHILMRQREIPHEFRVKDGDHKWEFWSSELTHIMEFISYEFWGGW